MFDQSADSTQESIVILFADVVDSTSLYETIGNVEAKQIVEQALSQLSEIAMKYDGEIVKYIGDEVLCRFGDPDKACNAAVEMQEATVSNDPAQKILKIKVGMDYGPVIVDGNDVFGDAVNVAARMASIATTGQIIITQNMQDHLSPLNQEKGQIIDRVPVRGKAAPIDLISVVWESRDDVTKFATRGFTTPDSAPETMTLSVGSDNLTIGSNDSFVIGRGANCNLAMKKATLASRVHAKIVFKRGKFVLIDQSTNGTYVKTGSDDMLYLRREELQLWGHGVICLGSEFEGEEDQLIYYST
jgi:adenylate cyclase